MAAPTPALRTPALALASLLTARCTAPTPAPTDARDEDALATDALATDVLAADAPLPPLPDVPDPSTAPTPALRLRRTLGVPDEARRVLVFGQNSHLDLDWLRTQEQYYRDFVERIYSEALDAIAADPDYRYATAEMGFLRMFYERRPERREALARALREGRFQVVGGGVSQPDVLLPTGENLLRDYQQGAAWLRTLGAAPTRACYLPDSFGLGASTPDALRAAGFESVAFWRADGNPDAPEFNASVADFGQTPPTPGTGAAALRADNQVDFLWEGPGGARVFAHWLTHGYMFGDYLDYRLINYRQYGNPVGQRLRDPELVAANIQTYIDKMGPQSPTDYLFVPIGGDFVYPKPQLAAFARHWNRTRFARTGVWVRAGTFDEYAQLAMTQSERLRVRRMEFLPYWMGFYASRPVVKEHARLGGAALDQAQTALALLRALGLGRADDPAALRELEWLAGATNHHDWITGTAVDPVTYDEQVPFTRRNREAAEAALLAAVQRLADAVPQRTGPTALVFNSESFARDGLVSVPLAAEAPASVRSVRLAPRDEPAAAPLVGQLASDRRSVYVAASAVPSVGLRAYALALRDEAEAAPTATLRCETAAGAESPCDDPAAARAELTTDALALRFDLAQGGALTSLRHEGSELLDGPGFELAVYEDSGGIYTFGNEGGGRFAPSYVAGQRATARRVRVLERGPVRTVLALEYTAMGLPYALEYTVPTRGAWVELRVTARTAPGTALLARFATNLASDGALMAVPAGALRRPVGGRFAPTFVPFEEWFAYENADGQRGVTLVAPSNPAVTYDAAGALALVLHRNAPTSDRGPSGLGGTTNDPATLVVRLAPYARGRTRRAHYEVAADLWHPLRARLAATGAGPSAGATSASLARVDGEARVSALRLPSDGSEGYLLRLLRTSDARSTAQLALDGLRVTRAARSDAMEREGEALAGFSATTALPLEAAYTTLRLR